MPTFRSTKSTIRTAAKRVTKEEDPFLYFSDQERRMTYLLTGRHHNNSDVMNSSRDAAVERKTRLSFEVHPSEMLIEELLSDFDEDDDSNVSLINGLLGLGSTKETCQEKIPHH